MRVLLDANVWGSISAKGNEAELAAVEAAVKAGRFSVFATSPLVEELSAAHPNHPQLALRMARQLFNLSHLWLNDAEVRIIGEVQRGGKLGGDDAFSQFRDPALFDHFLGVVVNEAAGRVRARKDYDEVSHRDLDDKLEQVIEQRVKERIKTKTLTPAQAHKQVTEEIFAGRHECAEGLSRGYLETIKDKLGHPPGWIAQCNPGDYPSLIRRWEFIATCQYRYPMTAKRGYDRGDLHDGAHFADAAYADLLVSDDKTFHTIVAETGIPTKMIKRCDPEWEALLRP